MGILTIFLAAFLGSSLGSSAEVLREFSDFKVKFNKVYKDNAEERYRLGVFSHNLRAVNDHNRGQSSYTRAINQFSDLTQEEFEATYLGGYKRLERPVCRHCHQEPGILRLLLGLRGHRADRVLHR